MKKRRISILPKKLIFAIMAFLIPAFIIGYAWQALSGSEYFKVKAITIAEKPGFEVPHLKGRNILLLDLPRESRYMARFCPDCSMVRIVRILPDRLLVEFLKRRPLALVKLYRYFAVDKDRVLFNIEPSSEDPGLPLITGVTGRPSDIILGKVFKSRELDLALSIIMEADRFPNLREYPIKKIDVGAANDIAVFISIGQAGNLYQNWQPVQAQKTLEVRISQGNIIEKIAVMSGLMNQEKNNLANINYIDLRFKEPVIKFKDAVK